MQETHKLKLVTGEAELYFSQCKPRPTKRQNGGRCFTTCILRIFDDYDIQIFSGTAIAHPGEEPKWNFKEGKRIAFSRMANTAASQRILEFSEKLNGWDADDVERLRKALKEQLYTAFFKSGGSF